MKRLERQLQMLPDLVSTYNLSQNLQVSKVSTIRTVCELFTAVPTAKQMFCEVDKLLRIYLTFPITTATAERSFSTLRRINTYLRSTMSQQRLNNVMLLHVHKDMCDDLDLERMFVKVNSRRLFFFGNF